MSQIGIFDIVGPIMVGPSSSHTAGAVRLGLAGRRILGEPVKHCEIFLHGSFAATYWGHRTDLALLAGLLGMGMDDRRIPQAKELAAEQGLKYEFHGVDLGDVHPNSVKMKLKGQANGCEIVGASIGGGRINITQIDGFEILIDGTYSVLITRHRDEPGVIAEVTRVMASHGVNIAYMEVSRKQRGRAALLVAQTDNPLEVSMLDEIKALKGIEGVRSLPCF